MKRILLILLTLNLVFVGCSRKEINYGPPFHGAKLTITPDWGAIDKVPGGVVVNLYPIDGPVLEKYVDPIVQYVTSNASRISLMYGTYKCFVYSDYTQNVLFRNMDTWELAEAYLRPNTLQPFSRNSSKGFIGNVEPLHLAQLDTFELTEEASDYAVTIFPKVADVHIGLTVPLVGAYNILQGRGTLSGIYDGVNLSTGKVNTNKVPDASIVFDFEPPKDTDTFIKAELICFGMANLQHIIEDPSPVKSSATKNLLNLAFLLKDGTEFTIETTFDISDAISREIIEDDKVNIVLTVADIGVITIPDVNIPVDPGDGGFEGEVGDWDKPIYEDL